MENYPADCHQYPYGHRYYARSDELHVMECGVGSVECGVYLSEECGVRSEECRGKAKGTWKHSHHNQPSNTLLTQHSTLNIPHSTFHPPHSTFHPQIHSSLHTPHSTLKYTPHSTLHIPHSNTLLTPHSTFHTQIHSSLHTPHSTLKNLVHYRLHQQRKCVKRKKEAKKDEKFCHKRYFHYFCMYKLSYKSLTLIELFK